MLTPVAAILATEHRAYLLAFAGAAILPLVEGCGWLEVPLHELGEVETPQRQVETGEAPMVVFGFFEFGGPGDRVPYERLVSGFLSKFTQSLGNSRVGCSARSIETKMYT